MKNLKICDLSGKLQDEIIKLDYERNFYNFLRDDAKGGWIDGKHLRLIASKLHDVVEGKIKKIIFTMPPRHGKSEMITKKFPAWFLLQNPDKEIIISSYSADLAFDFSRIARQTFEEHQGMFGVQLAEDNQSVRVWGIEGHRGGLMAAGVGGPITGRGFHIGIVDDPFKNRQEANSPTIREKVWDWYRSVFRTRAYPANSAIIIVMTRWHEDDLIGRLLAEQPEEWEVINLPAYAEQNDTIGREEGETLWPEWFPKKDYESIKKDIGSYEWMALYQQRPTSQGGNIFKQEWFNWVDNIPDDLRIYQNIDLAASSKTESDYFALLTYGIDEDSNIYLFDLYMGHIEFPQQVKTIQEYYNKWKPIQVGVEAVAYQNAMEQYLRDKTMIPVRKLKPSTDKVTRALKITPHFENGKVKILRTIPNRDLFETQLLQFPNGKHDDVVDVVSYIVDMNNTSTYASLKRADIYKGAKNEYY